MDGMSTISLSAQDLQDLRWAYTRLEHPSFAARLSTVLGTPIERGLQLLPRGWYQSLEATLEQTIRRMLETAAASVSQAAPSGSSDGLHKVMALVSGAVSGFFGPLALLIELPVTTALMLRSIADIAHNQGEDLAAAEARIACMQVFALGGRSNEDDAAETGYYGLRATLALHFLDYAGEGAASVPAVLNVVRAITARFGIVISEQAAAKMIPIAGAIGGALVNVMFMQHFQDVARGHFLVRRLERQYGSEAIRLAYEDLAREEARGQQEYSPLEGW
jgi:EcsC protein family